MVVFVYYVSSPTFFFFFFFNDTATTEIYTLSLHDALPILRRNPAEHASRFARTFLRMGSALVASIWRSPFSAATRTSSSRSEEHTSDSSHGYISYAVFCLKKKKKH